MPVLDWSRTDLEYRLSNGAKALRFERAAFDAFELFILKRDGCEEEIGKDRVETATARFEQMSSDEKKHLTQVIIAGLPGRTTAASNSLLEFRNLLESYQRIDNATLRQNLITFLEAIMPAAELHQVKLALHPDDPPFELLGLPRVVSTQEDVACILEKVESPMNGLCFCTGSFGVRPDNDLPGMIRKFGEHIHFVHLRSTIRDTKGNFYEADHLAGDVDMFEVMKALIDIQKINRLSIPMRPDHGHKILDDLNKKTNPGYSAIGRLKGLAELTGLELGVIRSQSEGAT